MDKIKELWSKLVAWAQGNPAVAGVAGLGALFLIWWGYKKMKRRQAGIRAARRARLAKKRKRSRR